MFQIVGSLITTVFRHKLLLLFLVTALSEKIAHSTVFHHLSHLFVNIQQSGLIKGCLLSLNRYQSTPEAAVLGSVHNYECFLNTGQKLRFNQLPNQHGTT